jgi:hypothetical protein
MDITTIVLIIGAVILVAVLIWAAVVLIGLAVFRKSSREMDEAINRRFKNLM